VTDREHMERLQSLWRHAVAIMEGVRHRGQPDASFLQDFRSALVQAGATGREIEASATVIISLVIDGTGDAEERAHQLELIAEHLCQRASMDVHLDRAGSVQRVVFPERPRIQ
jgi:hypothetical protein